MGRFLLYFFLFLTGTFSLTVNSGPSGIIKVRVTDSSGFSIEGVSWTYGHQSGVSDSRGEFNFTHEGKEVLELRRIGYEATFKRIDHVAESELMVVMKKVYYVGSEVIISATRAETGTPSAFSNLRAAEIRKINLGQDLPVLLQQLPGVLFTSDAGAGVGYTGISVRGSDATRVNVTLNGVPLNDAESHGLFWVNMPDLSSSITDIQVQRGVGTSTNGAAAFGASININTHRTIEKAFAEMNLSGGSFGTMRSNLKFGSGILPGGFSLEGRISKINSQGFIDRASSDLSSGMASLNWYGKKTQLHADILIGRETTYQSWNGIPEAKLKGDLEGIKAYIDRNGLDEQDARILMESGSRTYNPFTYENQIDRYGQDHYQLHFSHQFNSRWQWNQSLHYTRGKGYYEEFRKNEPLAIYGIYPVDGAGQTVSSGNLTRKRWLDNHFAGTVYSLIYHDSGRVRLIYGGAVNLYRGHHFGESFWNSFNLPSKNPYYTNQAVKQEINQFVRGEYEITKGLILYGDVQYRAIRYQFEGFDQMLRPATQGVEYGFFNPKGGISYSVAPGTFYYSVATGQREPVRDDFVNSSPGSRPLPEKLIDHELGWRQEGRLWSAGLNLYAMEYRNQLVLTGQINDVGAYTRINAGRSYRRGIEAEFRYRLCPSLLISGNAMFSENRIGYFESFTDNYDTGIQDKEIFEDTPIALSPGFIGFASIDWQPIAAGEISLSAKSAGRQYLDNTGAKARSIDPWTVAYLRGSYRWHFNNIKELSVFFMVNNLLNRSWESNGYTFGYIASGSRVQENFFFPQAGRNFLLGLTIRI